jgi:hypothetical protein
VKKLLDNTNPLSVCFTMQLLSPDWGASVANPEQKKVKQQATKPPGHITCVSQLLTLLQLFFFSPFPSLKLTKSRDRHDSEIPVACIDHLGPLIRQRVDHGHARSASEESLTRPHHACLILPINLVVVLLSLFESVLQGRET